jgi:arylsulfatase A-like enzyme
VLGTGAIGRKYPYTMPQALGDAGYRTMAIGKLHYAPQRNLHGFHHALLDESGRVSSPDFRSDYRSCWNEARTRSGRDRHRLERSPGKPTCCERLPHGMDRRHRRPIPGGV